MRHYRVAIVEMRDCCFFFFQAEDGIRDYKVTGVQTCALPICCAKTYLSRAPISTSSSGKPARTGRPSGPTEAAMIMPLDSTPRSLRGARLTTDRKSVV